MGLSAKRLRLRMFSNRITMQKVADRHGVSRPWIGMVVGGQYSGPASQEWLERIAATVEQIIEERKSK